MKLAFALALGLLPVVASAAPIQITLKPNAIVQPDAADYFTLGSVATLSGGSQALRVRLAAVRVGRAPLPGNVRHLTPGDLALKMRQAGYQPGRDAVLDGAAQADVTVAASAASNSDAAADDPSSSSAPAAPSAGPLIHAGDPITIRIDSGAISVTADGVAESAGAVGETIRVRRPGVASLLDASVVDAQTVELEF